MLYSNNNDEDVVDDYDNYKGIYYEEEPSEKYQDPITGAHFDYNVICERLESLKHPKINSEQREIDGKRIEKFDLNLNSNK